MNYQEEIIIDLPHNEEEVIIDLPSERFTNVYEIKNASSEEIDDKIENELFKLLEYTLNEPTIKTSPRKKKRLSKNYTKDSRNFLNKWLLSDGKKEYKNKHGQTCVKYICTFKHLDGSICGNDSYIKKNDISYKQYCKFHRKI
jgi:hypothetical protein